jgi:hypothetical protein
VRPAVFARRRESLAPGRPACRWGQGEAGSRARHSREKAGIQGQRGAQQLPRDPRFRVAFVRVTGRTFVIVSPIFGSASEAGRIKRGNRTGWNPIIDRRGSDFSESWPDPSVRIFNQLDGAVLSPNHEALAQLGPQKLVFTFRRSGELGRVMNKIIINDTGRQD